MTEYDVSADSTEINFAPSSVAEEVIQNVRTILATAKGSVPLDRSFGLDQAMLDKPLPIAMARLSQDAVAAIQAYEPRAKVIKVLFNDSTGAINGRLTPTVRIQING
ncbi:baseplate wedge protein [Pararheinheimera phage vB_PsoM_KLER1-1]|nr:baseplate wedge protein [Pararheinheimera phage vB_PsoM_KLER1-1]